jgi:hypothetical protein
MRKIIQEIDCVKLILSKSNPPQLTIDAKGWVNTGGWTAPKLIPSKQHVSEGIYHFDFCATPPSGTSTDQYSPVSAYYKFADNPEDLRGVCIHSSLNSIEKLQDVKTTKNSETLKYIPELETLMGIEITNDKLKIRVPSNGCTTKENFKIVVNKGFTGVPPYWIEIYRVVPDYCEAHIPDGIELEYDLKELDIEPYAYFTLQNMIGKVSR